MIHQRVKIPKVGQIFRAPSGLLRVCRHVSPCEKNPKRTSVFFTIKHCSWTGRCYTVYSLQDLFNLGYVMTKKRVRVRGKFAEKIVEEMTLKVARPPKITCCDVEGIS
jgi:hypothetical protein